jgi:hypothetical protein
VIGHARITEASGGVIDEMNNNSLHENTSSSDVGYDTVNMNEQSAAATIATPTAVLPPEHLSSYVNEQRLPATASSPTHVHQQVPHRLAQSTTVVRPASDTTEHVAAGVNMLGARHGSLAHTWKFIANTSKPTKPSKSKDSKK